MEIVRVLLDLGTTEDINSALQRLGELPDDFFNTAFRAACANGHTEIVRLLIGINHGLDPFAAYNEDVAEMGLTFLPQPLMVACERGYTEIVRLFLQ